MLRDPGCGWETIAVFSHRTRELPSECTPIGCTTVVTLARAVSFDLTVLRGERTGTMQADLVVPPVGHSPPPPLVGWGRGW